MQKIIFKEEGHKYYRESDGMALMSVSHFYSRFTPKYDPNHHACKAAAEIALGNKKYTELKKDWHDQGHHMLMPEYITYLEGFIKDKKTYRALVNKVRSDWKGLGTTSSAEGTSQHSDIENQAISDGFSVAYNGESYITRSHGKKPNGDNETVVECLAELEDGFYPELLLWYFFPEPVFSESLEQWICGIAGQSDMVYIKRGKSFVADLKSNKNLSDFGIKYTNFGYEYHSGPWSDLIYTRLSKYKIQLNTYGWLLDQHRLPPQDLRVLNKGNEIPIYYEPSRVDSGVMSVFNMGI